MDVKVVSQDAALSRMCREVLNEIPGHDCTISTGRPEDPRNCGDIWIWDFDPGMVLPPQVQVNAKQDLFLVHRSDLDLFRERMEIPEAHTLLKPVTRATLAAFLGLEISANRAGGLNDHGLRSDRDEILQWLIQTNLRLQEYDQNRTTFLARAVHDFRAPLTALSGYCGLLLSEPIGPLNENQREILRRMQHSTKRLSRMASAMFQLSVGRQMKRCPDLQKGDIRECLEQALHEIGPLADDKSIAITSDLESSNGGLYFEAGQIEQVIMNILDNACKFTPKGGSIEVHGYPYFWERRSAKAAIPPASERRRQRSDDPNAYRMDITDSGKPIPQEHLSSIFEEYTSYAGGKDRSGGGLGLAISRMIVSQHDGAVWAENSVSGPKFSFVLPVYRSEPRGSAEKQDTSLHDARVRRMS